MKEIMIFARIYILLFITALVLIVNKIFLLFKKYKEILFVRERLWYMLESLKLYEVKEEKVVNSSVLSFEIDSKARVTVLAHLSGDKFTKQLKNLEENLTAALDLPLISKNELPSRVVYKLGNIEKINQYVFNSYTLTREFFEDTPSPIIKLANSDTSHFFS